MPDTAAFESLKGMIAKSAHTAGTQVVTPVHVAVTAPESAVHVAVAVPLYPSLHVTTCVSVVFLPDTAAVMELNGMMGKSLHTAGVHVRAPVQDEVTAPASAEHTALPDPL